MVGNVGHWPAKTNVWTRVTQDLGNGGPLGMLSTAKPIKIKVLLHQFSLLMFNLHYMFLLTVFLPDRGIAALPQFFGKCRTIFSPRGPQGRKEGKQEEKKQQQHAVGTFFPACFLPYTSRSGRLACLSSHVLRAYCNFHSKQAISITLFGRRPIKKTYVNINWLWRL